MTERIAELIEKIKHLEEELEAEFRARRSALQYGIKNGKISLFMAFPE